MRHTFYTRLCQVTNFLAMVAITVATVAFLFAMLLLA